MKYAALIAIGTLLLFSACKSEKLYNSFMFWSLDNGEHISCYHKNPGYWYSDHDKFLDIAIHGKIKFHQGFAGGQSGYYQRQLWISKDHSKICLIDTKSDEHQVGITVDLAKMKEIANPEYDFINSKKWILLTPKKQVPAIFAHLQKEKMP